MSGISHLQDLFQKKGESFIDNLFNNFVTVNEKMDGSAFTFERSPESGKFLFYKRDQRNPITLVDRTLIKYYEKPINYIESLPPHIIQKIPRGWRFGLEYFHDNKPVEIVYDRVPKNNLILSYVHKNEGGKAKSTIQDKEKLDTWADLLGVERPPIIFQGRLTEEQKRKILEFLNTPFSDLVEEFKTRSFVRYIIEILNPSLDKTALNQDLDKAIEGIVFRFGENEENSEIPPILAKMVDPVFTQMAKEKAAKRTENKPSDFLGITVLDVMNFILERGIESFSFDGKTEDEKYISYMSDVFVKFLDENESKYKGADFEEPEYLRRDLFRLNKSLVKNKEVLSYIEKDDAFESLFKLILNQFRKIKKRSGGILSDGVIEQFNALVKAIEEKIEGSKENKKVNESDIPTFRDFKDSIRSKTEYLKEEDTPDFSEVSDAEINGSFNGFVSALETISKTKIKNESPLKEKENGDLEPINVLIGRFQPFHNGHLKMAEELKKKNGLPSIVAVINPGHNKSGKSPFSQKTIEAYMDCVVRDYPDLFKGFFILNKGLLGIVVGKAREMGYSVSLIGAGEDRMSDYQKQIDYLSKNGDRFPASIKLHQTGRVTSATEVRDLLLKDNFSSFKRLVPPCVASLYNLLISDVNQTSIKESLHIGEYLDLNESSIQDIGRNIHHINYPLHNIKSVINEQDYTADEENLERKIKKVFGLVYSADSICNEISKGDVSFDSPLYKNISLILFGENPQKKHLEFVEDLISSLSPQTKKNLEMLFSSEEITDFDPLTFQDLENYGSFDVFTPKLLNGITHSDILKLFSIDPKIPSGGKSRGKGEILTSLLFGGVINPDKGADVRIGDSLVEVKTTNNAAIGQKINPKISKFLKDSESYLGPKSEKGYGSKYFRKLIDKLRKDKEGSEEFWEMFENDFGNPLIEHLKDNPYLLCAYLLLVQMDEYQEEESFNFLLLFEEVNGNPRKMILFDGRGGFINEKNLNTASENSLGFYVYESSRTGSTKLEIKKIEDKK